MRGISLVTAAYNYTAASFFSDTVHVLSQHRISGMISRIGSQTQTYNDRPRKAFSKAVSILDAQHDITFCIGGGSLWYKMIFPQIRFCFFQLYNHNIRFRCSSQICGPTAQPAARRNSGHDGSMEQFIPCGYNFLWIVRLQCPVNIFSEVLGSENIPFRRRSRLVCLIPDCQYPAVPGFV